MPISTIDDVLWEWDALDGMQTRWPGAAPVIARSSTGSMMRRNRIMETSWPVDRPREHHVWRQVNGVWRQVPTLLLEPAMTNHDIYSTDLGNASGWIYGTGSQTVTQNAKVAPNGTLTASTFLNNGNPGNMEVFRYFGDANLTNSVYYTSSIFVRPMGGFRWLAGYVRNKDAGVFQCTFDLVNGVVGSSAVNVAAGNYGIERLPFGWFRVWFMWYSGSATGNDPLIQWRFQDADDVATNSMPASTGKGAAVWGAQSTIGKHPTSFIPTTTTAVTRSGDSFYWDGAPEPQAMVLYLRFIEIGRRLDTDGRHITFGNTAEGVSRLILYSASTLYNFYYQNGDGSNANVGISGSAPAVGQECELLGELFSDGSVKLHQRIEGGTIVSTAASSAPAGGIKGAWGGGTNRVYIGNGFYVGGAMYESFKVVKSAAFSGMTALQMMDTMKVLKSDGRGNLIKKAA